MIYIILYWIFLFFLTSIIGNAAVLSVGIKRPHVAIIPLIGVFGITLLASIYGVFGGLSIFFELPLMLSALVVAILTRNHFLEYLKRFWNTFKEINFYLRFLFIFILFLAALKSSGAPFILDNETYYIATIKWLDQYGFVPGLANLHLFLGQQSGWHIAQSSLNLDYLHPGFNDLNGFCLVLVNLYVMDKLNQYFQFKNVYSLIIGLFPIFYVLLFQFLSSPSPDLPIYLLTVLIVGEFFDHREATDTSKVAMMLLLAIFASYIKVTALTLLVFPIVAFLFYKKGTKERLWIVVCTGLIAAFLFGLKNYIISGYILYPLSFVAFEGIDWILPKELLTYIVDTTKAFGFYLTTEDYLSKSNFELFLSWWSMSGLHGYFNKYWILLLAVFPILLFFRKENKSLLLIYVASIIQFVILWFSSPQYRFYLGFMIVLSSVFMALIVHKRIRLIGLSLVISVLLIIVTTFFNLNVTTLTENDSHSSIDSFDVKYLIKPHGNSKYVQAGYKVNELDGTTIYNPENIDFFWAVGDCPIPCIQMEQYNYFKYYFKVIPSMRGENLKDGFYAKNITNDGFEFEENP